MSSKHIMLGLSLAAALAACGGEESVSEPEPAAAAEDPGAAEATEEVAEPELAEATEADFPLPEDFVEEAEQEITAENLEDQLASMEAAVSGESE